MRHAVVKSLLAHKLRLALTAISVVLGVSFITGTLVLTDTLSRTFDTLFGDVYKNTDVVVRAKAAFTDIQSADSREPVPAGVLDKVRTVNGVTEEVGEVEGYAQLVDPNTGKAVTTGGAPTLGETWTGSALSPLRLQSGRGPTSAGEVAIDASTADRRHIRVGDRVKVLLRGPVQSATVVGIVRFGSSGNAAGATIVAFDPTTAQRQLGVPGTYTSISIKGAAGVSQSTLRDRVAGELPTGYEALTGKALAKETASQIQQALGFIKTFLLVFAVIALFVGSFIIANTFSMLVAQRTRELALLRAVGASRRQVTRSVLAEALVVGVLGATVGLAFGLLVAVGLQALLGAFGAGLPKGPLVFKPATAVWAYVVGVGVTTIAAYLPARRASKIAPVAALRDDVALPERSLRRRAVAGVMATAVGAAAMAAGLAGAGSTPALLVGLGALVVFIGVATLSPFASRPVIRVLGAPLGRLFGTAGGLSRENALRNPRRTAATAAALMIGLALISAMTVMASSVKSSTSQIIDRSLGADYLAHSANYQGFSTDLASKVAAAAGVRSVSTLRFGKVQVGAGGNTDVIATQPEGVQDALNLHLAQGSIAGVGDRGLLVDEKVAKEKHWRVGQVVPVTFARTGRQQLTLAGTYSENQVAGKYLISTATYDKNFSSHLDNILLVAGRHGVPAKTTKAAVTAAAAAFPNVTVEDQTEFKKSQSKQVDQLLGLVTALLGLAVLIAVLGIVNTLALSVIERTREIGLLRAVGMSRRQLRRMIRLESVIISVFGALLGLVVGVVFGWALVRALKNDGISTLVIPVGQLALYVVLAGVVGVLAAVLPARRAAKLNVLRAVAST